jgi:hypothetical protein
MKRSFHLGFAIVIENYDKFADDDLEWLQLYGERH